MIRRRQSSGFTLIEVMVALAVVAVALPALMMSLYQQIDGTAYLRDKSLANMVAANRVTEIRILAEATRSLPEGRDSGVRELAGREWYWWQESTKTELPDFFRIEIKVALGEEQEDEALVTLAIFLSGDLVVEAPVEQEPGGQDPGGPDAGGPDPGEQAGDRSGGQPDPRVRINTGADNDQI